MFLKKTITLLAVVSLLVACNDNRVQVTETGLKYQLHDQNKDGRKPKIGDVVTFHLIVKNSKDSVLSDTYKGGQPQQMMLQVPPFKGSFEEGMAMLAKGDSASFFVNADSLFTRMGQQVPPIIAKGSDIKFTVKIVDVQNEQEFQKAMTEKQKGQTAADAKIVDDYCTKKGIKATKTKSGLAYAVLKEGNGAKPAAGDVVSVHYVGKLTNDKEFDSSYRNPQAGGKPVDFPIGVGQVIPGWDEGVMNMTKGSKHLLVIPSNLGYGPQPQATIPANSVLVFEVELIDFKKGQPAPQR
jgi:FKBP-type peptidyl-prolyl cis-trans isomerase FkpA